MHGWPSSWAISWAPKFPNIPAVVLGGGTVVVGTAVVVDGTVVAGAVVVVVATVVVVAGTVVVVAGTVVVVAGTVVVVVVGAVTTVSTGRPRASFSARCAARVAGPYQPSASTPSTCWSSTASELRPQE